MPTFEAEIEFHATQIILIRAKTPQEARRIAESEARHPRAVAVATGEVGELREIKAPE